MGIEFKWITWDQGATAVIEDEFSFDLNAQFPIPGWEIGIGFKRTSKSRIEVRGESQQGVACMCNPLTGKWE
jgi:hypothetical protein